MSTEIYIEGEYLPLAEATWKLFVKSGMDFTDEVKELQREADSYREHVKDMHFVKVLIRTTNKDQHICADDLSLLLKEAKARRLRGEARLIARAIQKGENLYVDY